MIDEAPVVMTWMGRDIRELPRDELLDVIRQMGAMLDKAEQEVRHLAHELT